MTDVALIWQSKDWTFQPANHARWLLLLVPMFCALLGALPIPIVTVTLLETVCAATGAYARHHSPDLDHWLAPPWSLAVGVCSYIVLQLVGVAYRVTLLMHYLAFAMVGYTLVALVAERQRQMESYRRASEQK